MHLFVYYRLLAGTALSAEQQYRLTEIARTHCGRFRLMWREAIEPTWMEVLESVRDPVVAQHALEALWAEPEFKALLATERHVEQFDELPCA